MLAPATPIQAHLAAAMARERSRLVRVCAALTGDLDAVEDLAQETLLQAWTHADKLHDHADSAGIARWLDAFARNVCLRWRRAQGRAEARLAAQGPLLATADGAEPDDHDTLPDPDALDPADACERAELERLVERALAKLPAPTRDVLVHHYFSGLPHAEIAAGLGLSEGVVAQRLHRGRQALRRVLASDQLAEGTMGVLSLPAEDAPVQTRVWCPICGARRLEMYCRGNGRYGFACPRCFHGATMTLTGACIVWPAPQTGLTSPKSILSRQLLWLSDYYHSGLARREVNCETCGGTARVFPHMLPDLPESVRASLPSQHGTTILCPRCGIVDNTPLSHLALDLPQSVRFWRAHPRIQRLPEREVESEGQPAIITTYDSVSDGARLEVLTARESLQVLAVHGAPGP